MPRQLGGGRRGRVPSTPGLVAGRSDETGRPVGGSTPRLGPWGSPSGLS